MTRGVLDVNRQAVYIADADVVWNGHSHTAFIVPSIRERLVGTSVVHDVAWYVRSPGYCAPYRKTHMDWYAERAMPPSPVGCVTMTIELDENNAPHLTFSLKLHTK